VTDQLDGGSVALGTHPSTDQSDPFRQPLDARRGFGRRRRDLFDLHANRIESLTCDRDGLLAATRWERVSDIDMDAMVTCNVPA